MDPNTIFQNPWIIGMGTCLIAAFLCFVFTVAWRRVQAYFGPFSGQYVAFTWLPQPGLVLIEDIRCRHTGSMLSGKIRGVAFVHLKQGNEEIEELAPNRGAYRFRGFVNERVFVIS